MPVTVDNHVTINLSPLLLAGNRIVVASDSIAQTSVYSSQLACNPYLQAGSMFAELVASQRENGRVRDGHEEANCFM
jgi:hypothetical protein